MKRRDVKIGRTFRYDDNAQLTYRAVKNSGPFADEAADEYTSGRVSAFSFAFLDDGVVLCDAQPAKPAQSADVVSPSHYRDLSPEPITVIRDWRLGFNLGCALKYISRAGRKVGPGESPGGKKAEDLRKAIRYLEFEIAACEATAGGQ